MKREWEDSDSHIIGAIADNLMHTQVPVHRLWCVRKGDWKGLFFFMHGFFARAIVLGIIVHTVQYLCPNCKAKARAWSKSRAIPAWEAQGF